MSPAKSVRPDESAVDFDSAVRTTRLTTGNEADVRERIENFVPLDFPAGRDAARFLIEDAVRLEKISRTYLLLTPERLEGFFSLCMGSVKLTRDDIEESLEIEAPLTVMPAAVLTWIARGRDSRITGLTLMETAYGVARETSRTIAAAAFALDPADSAVAQIWKSAPYGFRATKSSRKPPRLWTPLEPDF